MPAPSHYGGGGKTITSFGSLHLRFEKGGIEEFVNVQVLGKNKLAQLVLSALVLP